MIGSSGRKAEKKLAKRIGGKQTPASGAAGAKGDVEQGPFLIENKSTTKDRFSIDIHTLAKINGEAIMANRLPALAVQFVDTEGRSTPSRQWVMIPEWVWAQMRVQEDE